MVRRAVEIPPDGGIHFYASMLVAAAELRGATRISSETSIQARSMSASALKIRLHDWNAAWLFLNPCE